ncbi:MAG: CapA family protein [Clostridia bacterium]|nr:CapA family protein [Clostridia bacterium]
MKILIGADVVPTSQTEELFVKQDLKTLFGDIADMIQAADRTVINLECALTDAEQGIKKFGPCLKADPKCADALKTLGVTDIMLANNHMFDFGVKGMVDTLNNLDRVGLPYTGCGANDTDSRKPYIVEQDGKKVGFINVCEHEYSYALPDRMGANPFDPFLTMQDIRALKKQVDFVIVLYHGAKEHCRYPSPRMVNLTREMVLCGADVVITQHSHCIVCYEQYENGHILHGQGNFHFCWDGRAESWYTSLLVELEIDDGLQIKFYPILTKEHGIEIAKGQTGEEIMSAFAARSTELKNGKWKDGWHAFCESVTWYKTALNGLETPETTEQQTQRFAHFLDCEAHTDVWRELYPTWNHTNEK